MTDKQIIIDDQKKTIHRLQDECTEKTNAIIALGEQLKAKEQECEELKNELIDVNWKIEAQDIELNDNVEQLDQLKAENDELKKLLKVRIEDLCDSCGASSMMPMPCKVYEKTLTEIKEIIQNQGHIDILEERILQKISECEVDDANKT